MQVIFFQRRTNKYQRELEDTAGVVEGWVWYRNVIKYEHTYVYIKNKTNKILSVSIVGVYDVWEGDHIP